MNQNAVKYWFHDFYDQFHYSMDSNKSATYLDEWMKDPAVNITDFG